MKKPSVIVKDLRIKIQDTTVLDGISFSLLPGQHLALVGNSGSGKTTLAKAFAGKIHFSGSISTGLNSTFSKSPAIALVEQRYSFKNLSGSPDFYYQQRFNSFDADNSPTIAGELLNVVREGENGQEKMELIESGLQHLGILHLKDAPLIQLSSGEHKRFQLVKALLNPPALLILDSPYTGLDVASRAGLNKMLNGLTKRGTQLLLIPGTFPVPGFITHLAHLENKLMTFFGEKEYFDSPAADNFHENECLFVPSLLPIGKERILSGTAIEMLDVTIKYGNKTIVEKLNWKVKHGEKWLLKGRNGAGKSSLLSLVTGDHPQAYCNEIYLFGKKRGSGESIWDLKKNTGFVSPELHAYFDKTVSCYQVIGSGFFDTIGLFKKLNPEQNRSVMEWLDFLQLTSVQTRPLHAIPASLQRLALLGRALVKNPPLLILDEPCQGLDLQQRDLFISLVDHICSQSEKTLIYISHDEEEIPGCIQKVLYLQQGKQTIYLRNKHAAMAAMTS